MGLLKSLKNVRDMVHAAPGIVERAKPVQSVHAKQGSDTAVAAAPPPAAGVPAADLEPIAGVTLETYAQICKQAAAMRVDDDGVVSIAREHDVDATSWREAAGEWAERFKGNVPLAVHYGAVYEAA